MSRDILVLNGPNLNLLGLRQPDIYGSDTLADVQARCDPLADSLNLTTDWRQSNHEGQLIDWIHDARTTTAGIVINAGAYTHTSIAIHDALNAYDGKVVEVHISDIHAREAFRHHSYISERADEVIIGKGVHGYHLALEWLGKAL